MFEVVYVIWSGGKSFYLALLTVLSFCCYCVWSSPNPVKYLTLPWDLSLECLVTESMECVACQQWERIPKGPQSATVWNCEAVIHSSGVVVYVVRHVGKMAKSTYEIGSEHLVKM